MFFCTAKIQKIISKKYNFISKEQLKEKISFEESKEYEQSIVKEGRNSLVFAENEGESERIGTNFDSVVTYDLHTAYFLGQKLEFKYKVGAENGRAISQIIIASPLGYAKFGSDGIFVTLHQRFSGRFSVYKYTPSFFPYYTLELLIGGSLDILVQFTSEEKWQLKIVLTGTLEIWGENRVGYKFFFKVKGGIHGTCLKGEASVTVDSELTGTGLHFWGGKVDLYLELSFIVKTLTVDVNIISPWQFR